jgi:hypothetical protein
MVRDVLKMERGPVEPELRAGLVGPEREGLPWEEPALGSKVEVVVKQAAQAAVKQAARAAAAQAAQVAVVPEEEVLVVVQAEEEREATLRQPRTSMGVPNG